MKRLIVGFVLFLSVLFTNQAAAQPEVRGTWKGTITKDMGILTKVFSFEIFLHQQGHRVYGRSYVRDENIYGVMTLEGTISKKGVLQLEELKIVRNEIQPNWEWCLKKMFLTYEKNKNLGTLEGLWEGYTSFSICPPGKIKLERIHPQA